MAITRRQFIKRSGLVAAGMLGPGLFGNPFVRRALADTIGDRYFIVLFLDGGNDGLNTVVPADNGSGTLRDDYEAARSEGVGGLRLTPADLAETLLSDLNPTDPNGGLDPNTGAPLALHPGFRGLPGLPGEPGLFAPELVDNVAVIQGCGYPDYSLSHDEARRIWKSGDPTGTVYAGTGWVGRHLAANYAGGDVPAVCIDDAIAGELRQTATSVLAVRSLSDFGFPYDTDYEEDNDAKKAAFLALCGQASVSAQATVKYLGNTGSVTLLSSEAYRAAARAYDADANRQPYAQEYEDLRRSTGRDLREIAKVIYGVENGLLSPSAGARFFQLSNGGYDTHSDQGAGEASGQHFSLHGEVAAAINIFYRDVASMASGMENKMCILVWSEFGRRIQQNNNGTDHGSQGPMFVIGGAVNGGVYGVHPNIAVSAQDGEGNSVYRSTPDVDGFKSTDFRDVYGTVLKHWLNLPAGLIVPGVLRTDPGSAPDYWTAPNFDLGFI